MDEKEMLCDENILHGDVVGIVRKRMLEDEIFDKMATLFKSMADATRAKIIWALDQSEMCVCDLTEILGMSQSAISHQLASLRKDKLVKTRREGKEVFYSIADYHVRLMLESGIEHAKE